MTTLPCRPNTALLVIAVAGFDDISTLPRPRSAVR
jgi:hypothetical protein